jgi:hypothetical protein
VRLIRNDRYSVWTLACEERVGEHATVANERHTGFVAGGLIRRMVTVQYFLSFSTRLCPV